MPFNFFAKDVSHLNALKTAKQNANQRDNASHYLFKGLSRLNAIVKKHETLESQRDKSFTLLL